MARPREFDTDRALDRAMEVFWAKGYEATSLDELCEATGLSRSSLYGAFGDKRALLLKSLDHYIERGNSRIAAALARPVPIRQAISDLLDDFVDRIVAGPGRKGCFIGNCAVELAGHDRQAMDRVRRALARNEALLEAALIDAKKKGELSPALDPTAVARFLTSAFQGLRLVGKANPDRAALQDIAVVILKCLDA